MKRLRKDCGGFTLVEIMVTFTLTAIFMGSAALVLSTFTRSHTVASAVATEQNVASIVMETVSSNLGAARYDSGAFSEDFSPKDDTAPTLPVDKTDEEKKECMLLIGSADGNSVVWYVDGKTENIVKMSVKKTGEGDEGKGYLALDYYVKPEIKPGEPAEVGAVWDHVPWQLGEGVYQNCSVESFKVERLGDDNSCLSVTITLRNGIAGDDNHFTLNRTFDCYNLAAENIVELTS